MPGSALAAGRPVFPPFYVPYKSAAVLYDGLGFSGFPERQKWDVQDRPMDPADPMREAFLLRRFAEQPKGEPNTNRENHHAVDQSVDDKAAFIQAWLFFGALSETFKTVNMDIQVSDFLEEVDEVTVVSTARLHEYGQKWAMKEASFGPEGRENRVRKVYGVIREAEFFLSRWAPEGLYDDEDDDKYHNSSVAQIWGPQRQTIHQIYFSAVIVSRFIRITAGQIFPGEEGKARLLVSFFGKYLLGWQNDKTEYQKVTNFMDPPGQCPSEAQMLRERLVGAPKIFLYYLKRPTLQLDHRQCSRYQCKIQEVPDGTYRTKHTSPACCCAMVSVDGTELAHILQTGKIPRVRISQHAASNGDTEHLSGLTATVTDEGPYIAISHVWSHGLGNALENSLPSCQLLRLKNYVASLATDLGFDKVPDIWIDTLCIPVDPKLKASRRLAIELIPRTFDESSHVLVLDEELYTISLYRSSMMELGLRILCCLWMRRLWTLAEGVRAVRFTATRGFEHFVETVNFKTTPLSFQFLEGSLPYNELSQMGQRSRTDMHDLYCCHDLWAALEYRLPAFSRSTYFNLSGRLFDLSIALKFRTTSWAEDEAVCLALLLNLPTMSITSLRTPAERMKELYILIKDFSTSIVFMTFQPQHRVKTERESHHLKNDTKEGDTAIAEQNDAESSSLSPNLDEFLGFRWAPRSFLSSFPGIGEEQYRPWATCDAQGLHGEYDGFVFNLGGFHSDNELDDWTRCTNPSLGTILTTSRFIFRHGKENHDNCAADGTGCHKRIARPDDDFMTLEWKWENCKNDTELQTLFSSWSLRSPQRGAILFDFGISAQRRAILGFIDDNISADASQSSADGKQAYDKNNVAYSNEDPEEERELKFYPLAKGYSHSPRYLAEKLDADTLAKGILLLGQLTPLGTKWCIR